MATRDTLWTCVGITRHVSVDGSKEVVKVRCGVDLAKRVKSSQSKSYVKSKGERLIEKRTDFISLPEPMLRIDSLKYALAAEEFQDPSDQALIQEQIESRVSSKSTTSRTTVKKEVKMSLDAIKGRQRLNLTADKLLEQLV